MRVALIGGGYWGRKLYTVLAKQIGGVNLWLVDTDPDVWVGQIQRESDFRKCLYLVEAVVIATPPKTHYAIAMECLEAGKHVLVEKPMALSGQHARNLYAEAARHRLTLMVDDTWTKWPGLMGRLGPKEFSGKRSYFYWANPRARGVSEEGILWTQGPHPVSLAISAMGRPPERVSKASAFAEWSSFLMRWGDVSAAEVHLTWVTNQKVRAFRTGTLTKDGKSVYGAFDSLYEDQIIMAGASQAPDPLSEIVRSFLEHVKTDIPYLDLRGVQVVETLEMVEKAARS